MVDLVDDACGKYVAAMQARGHDPGGVRAETLAYYGKVSTGYMGTCLQVHRTAQTAAGTTKFVLVCEGYGSSARWKILSKPGNDLASIQVARRQHARYVVRDAVSRLMSDQVHEIYPSLHHNTQIDQMIDSASKFAANSFDNTLQFIESVL